MKSAGERIIERAHRFIRQAQKIAAALPGIECLRAAASGSPPALVAAPPPNGTATRFLPLLCNPGALGMCALPPPPCVLFHLNQRLSVIRVGQVKGGREQAGHGKAFSGS